MYFKNKNGYVVVATELNNHSELGDFTADLDNILNKGMVENYILTESEIITLSQFISWLGQEEEDNNKQVVINTHLKNYCDLEILSTNLKTTLIKGIGEGVLSAMEMISISQILVWLSPSNEVFCDHLR